MITLTMLQLIEKIWFPVTSAEFWLGQSRGCWYAAAHLNTLKQVTSAELSVLSQQTKVVDDSLWGLQQSNRINLL